jgi:hypothetical protein
MPKFTDEDSFHGSAIGTWLGRALEGAGMLATREVYVDFGKPLGKSPLASSAVLDNSIFVSQTGPPSAMTPGQAATVSLTFTNTGTTTWLVGTYSLHSQNPVDNTNWGVFQVALGAPVAPAGSVTFTFGITAPLVAGTYNFQWQMKHDGVALFGALSGLIVVVVSGAIVPADNAAFVSQVGVPATMAPGATANITLTMNNNGGTTWTVAGLYKLGSSNPQNNGTWGFSRAPLPSTTLPAANAVVMFVITAPLTPGTYNFQWQMVNDSVPNYFGASSPNVSILVTTGGACTPIAAPTVTKNGSRPSDTFTYSYRVACWSDALRTTLVAVTATATVTDGPGPLGLVARENISLPLIPGAFLYDFYRTQNSYTGSPFNATTVGLIATASYGAFPPPIASANDTGQAGDGTSPPAC